MDSSYAEPIRQAKDLYYQGIYGDKAAGEKSDKLFTALHKQLPNNPLVTVYYGSLRLLEAQHTWALWKKNSLSKQGVQLMDSAVKAAPDNLEVRFVRVATDRSLPVFSGANNKSNRIWTILFSVRKRPSAKALSSHAWQRRAFLTTVISAKNNRALKTQERPGKQRFALRRTATPDVPQQTSYDS